MQDLFLWRQNVWIRSSQFWQRLPTNSIPHHYRQVSFVRTRLEVHTRLPVCPVWWWQFLQTLLAITVHLLVWSILASGNTLWIDYLDGMSTSCLLHADIQHSPVNIHGQTNAPPQYGQDQLKRKYQTSHYSHHPMSCRSLNTSSWTLCQTRSMLRASPLKRV